MKIIDATSEIDQLYINGEFQIDLWKKYINEWLHNRQKLFIEDVQSIIASGRFSFEKDYLPILNLVFSQRQKRLEAIHSFEKLTSNLDNKIFQTFGKRLDVTIMLYLGLCNGAGWAIELDNQLYILLGIEKIIELDLTSEQSMHNLIYHELGHIYHMQHGAFNQSYQGEDYFLWLLFTEGVAMYFEQKLVGDFNYFHQDVNGWLEWCDRRLPKMKQDFDRDLAEMTVDNQNYFGDWVNYQGRSDCGYYLGARFVQYICSKDDFNQVIHYEIDQVRDLWQEFLKL
ncbi:hypothetical protein [Facklamia sp. 7083-14-GEN3]|uniref:hypothetical protein n=1 Tax=Facklamia sp. 7083-14-GEN3 TaxID=2973478 RepID=UPI00215C34FD|nr:hypothetical protein [Facklamia sp. 7083-14-GEN3]MCR8968487.1 hypothetical protein [Facklamia sp. 7083-14-GEN3]